MKKTTPKGEIPKRGNASWAALSPISDCADHNLELVAEVLDCPKLQRDAEGLKREQSQAHPGALRYTGKQRSFELVSKLTGDTRIAHYFN